MLEKSSMSEAECIVECLQLTQCDHVTFTSTKCTLHKALNISFIVANATTGSNVIASEGSTVGKLIYLHECNAQECAIHPYLHAHMWSDLSESKCFKDFISPHQIVD